MRNFGSLWLCSVLSLICLVSCGRKLQQNDGSVKVEAASFAKEWLTNFLRTSASSGFQPAVPRETAPLVIPEQEAGEPSPEPTQTEEKPVDCTIPGVPTYQVAGRTLTRVNKEEYVVFVPVQYEVQPFAKVRSVTDQITTGLVGVKSKGLNFVVEVGTRTKTEETICGNWIYETSGNYKWKVFADHDAEIDLFFNYRPHGSNGAASQVAGVFPDQKFNVTARSALFLVGSNNQADQQVDIDLQGRQAQKKYAIDVRLKGNDNKLSNKIIDGTSGYVVEPLN
uniref:Lipoprotein n=1 Tax=Tetraselmis sp. GSL018 TaxID=582737 RepID=A0A061S9L8_9CHLO|mmetsp:Transcript_5044/g.12299  ORF Transcript_5044/g.12299 Transcript_5044/m.12299 type:complete len:281 (+) Transcript_5044:360-1202(+)|eukprot:CAMPEP_0177589686 /NCGR_PEP_ID=MMETSP0419_2-20121207/6958_1 /TAXON_ID=582737 /ORGANISM="Tetraselmis sp., Strain GSL018" /LENGTH=280 /DNA_ID=CAMNT_0019080101 /DNA_START=293 /DNA_END=1135 /DNA_ORIENTATION=-